MEEDLRVRLMVIQPMRWCANRPTLVSKCQSSRSCPLEKRSLAHVTNDNPCVSKKKDQSLLSLSFCESPALSLSAPATGGALSQRPQHRRTERSKPGRHGSSTDVEATNLPILQSTLWPLYTFLSWASLLLKAPHTLQLFSHLSSSHLLLWSVIISVVTISSCSHAHWMHHSSQVLFSYMCISKSFQLFLMLLGLWEEG